MRFLGRITEKQTKVATLCPASEWREAGFFDENQQRSCFNAATLRLCLLVNSGGDWVPRRKTATKQVQEEVSFLEN
ncbi:hypothetical protein GT50_09830 [Geobacillus stearothermophilus 10]|nr:hypothetical protein GT50_09830 [Geobacillus stearothermophilus 10]